MQLILASERELQELKATLAAGGSRRSKREALSQLGKDRPAPVPFGYSSHYLAYATTYLRDEELIPDRDWSLSDSISKARHKLTSVFPRTGVDLDVLHPERYDVMELRREFHGGGKLSDPVAGEALLDAIRVLRQNYELLQDGDAFIIAF